MDERQRTETMLADPEKEHDVFLQKLQEDMADPALGYAAYKVCDFCLKILVGCSNNFDLLVSDEKGRLSEDATKKYYFDCELDLCDLQKEAEELGLDLSYNCTAGIYMLKTMFSRFGGKGLKGRKHLSLKEVLLIWDIVEEVREKSERLFPSDWQEKITIQEEDPIELRYAKTPLLEFIENQIGKCSAQITVSRISGLCGISKDIAKQLIEHISWLKTKSIEL